MSYLPRVHLPLLYTSHCFFLLNWKESWTLPAVSNLWGSGRVEGVSRKYQVDFLLFGALVSLEAGLSRHTRPRRDVHGWMVPPGVLRKERLGTWPSLLRAQQGLDLYDLVGNPQTNNRPKNDPTFPNHWGRWTTTIGFT